MDDQAVRERVAQADSLLSRLEQVSDAEARLIGVQAVQALLALYGEGLARMMAHVARAAQNGRSDLWAAFAEDELVSHLLLLHGLHPLDVETRARRALEALQPYLASQGSEASLLAVGNDAAVIQLQGSAHAAVKTTVERAILEAAPELLRVEVQGESGSGRAQPGGFISLDSLEVRTNHGD